ncbi:nickel-dependent hydrogenase large subunit [Desulfobaculum bizertense]|uniref:Ni,Fe-hydrogenase III large subunit n=1 Tax=Desulfobaculum bizertense DSM 18034 TaxID=1121442 RepID=A0A1T4VT84_9BACT|nr:nickel-dependent hydrogenase large subunit [Desulfobaculum bizertense]UIJ38434.1 nickel-dependent hydrogenase large subunit [Desulfobaculum bizertense]SKA68119.1 Ni,Fe-hydrogenase III large subunit [Desulfobaculum bizertense DSM 18034]
MASFTIPVGPLHVALEEPMYFRVNVEGETVKGVEMYAGNAHRGMEALARERNIFQNVVLTERVCSLCSNNHPLTYCMSVEHVAGITVPDRALYLRTIADEVKRIASHMFNVGISTHVIGFQSLFMHAMELREKVQDLKENVWGNRMDLAANMIGGVKFDIDDEIVAYMTRTLESLKKPCEEFLHLYMKHPQVKARTEGVGLFPYDEAVRHGSVGPVARGSALDNDVRKETPYAAYDRVDFDVITESGCDVRSRAVVRLREIFESISILEQCLRDMPSGPLACDPLPEIPAGESIARSEAPRGELIYYLRTNGTLKPERLKWRVPTYVNWEALKVMLHDCKVADIALIVNSIDPCLSCTER